MKVAVIFVVAFCVMPIFANNDPEALRECKRHGISIDKFPKLVARFDVEKCRLECLSGDKLLLTENLNENKPCPGDHRGTCARGYCMMHTSSPEFVTKSSIN